jgi:hypothetical protein
MNPNIISCPAKRKINRASSPHNQTPKRSSLEVVAIYRNTGDVFTTYRINTPSELPDHRSRLSDPRSKTTSVRLGATCNGGPMCENSPTNRPHQAETFDSLKQIERKRLKLLARSIERCNCC